LRIKSSLTTKSPVILKKSLEKNREMSTRSLSRSGNHKDGSTSTNMQLQLKYHNDAYEQLQQGLAIEERSDKPESKIDAISFYRKGTEILRKAVRIEFTDTEWQQPQVAATHEKLINWLKSIEERVQELDGADNSGVSLKTQQFSTTAPSNKRGFVDLTLSSIGDQMDKLTSIANGSSKKEPSKKTTS